MKKKTITFSIIIIGLTFVAYLLYNGHIPNMDGVFTNYETIKSDSLEVPKDSVGIRNDIYLNEEIDTISNLLDSLGSNVDSKNVINSDTSAIKELKGKESIFQVNTSYEKIADAQVAADKLNMVSQHKIDNDLFAELLLSDEEDKHRLSKAFSENTIPYNSILKLLSIAGQDILLKEDNHISQMIVDAIGESDHVTVICIVDRKGNIAYSSHKTLANSSILSSLTNINLESDVIQIDEANDQTWVAVPIFHTYGKIGNALININ